METLYDRISSNKRSSYVLFVFFIVIVSSLGYVFGYLFKYPITGFAMALMLASFLAIFSYYSGDSTILTISKARAATKKEFPHFVNTVEGLAIAAGIPTPKAFVIDEESINAFATGRDPKHASVTVTTGALRKLNRAELEGVIGHELSHIRNYDIRMMMLVAVMVGVTALLSDMLLRTFIYGRGRGKGQAGAIILIVGLVLAILSPIIAQLIKFAISRKREYLADADGALLTRHPKGLADALKKIQNDSDKIVDAANKATAHLYIENPLRKHKGWSTGLFNTHPPLDTRIKALEAM